MKLLSIQKEFYRQSSRNIKRAGIYISDSIDKLVEKKTVPASIYRKLEKLELALVNLNSEIEDQIL